MATLSKYSLKVTYTADFEDHVNPDGYCSDLDLDPVYSKKLTDTIRLYHYGDKYVSENCYRYLMHDPGQIVFDSELIDISSVDMMNDQMVTYLTDRFTVSGCSRGGSGVCGARGIFNVNILSVELLKD